MANNLFKLIKSGRGNPHPESSKTDLDVHSLIRCSSEEARQLVPLKLAEKLNILPLAVIEMQRKKLLTVAAPENSHELRKSLQFSSGVDIKLIPLPENILKKAIFLAYNGTDSALLDNIKELNAKSATMTTAPISFGVSDVKCEVNDFIKTLLSYAISRKASDIHFIPGNEGLFIKLRIDGELRTHEKPVCNLAIYKRIVSRVKTLSKLDPTKNEIAHDGVFLFELDGINISFRVSIMPTIHGEKIVLRLHGIRDLLSLENLGLSPKLFEFFESSIERMSGLIICAGTTGSGKSTSLYALLERISRFNKSILTVEDPVEIRVPFAAQTNINPERGISYADALKTALRQDPDCIMIGELRDSISAKIAFEAALTGHLVLTTLHAGGVLETIQRLHEMGIDRLTLSQTCNLLVYQRLIPSLCDSCKVFDLNSSKECEFNVYKRVGCSKCDYSGYRDRVIAAEALRPDSLVKNVLANENLKKLPEVFCETNYLSLASSLSELWTRGRISRSDYIL